MHAIAGQEDEVTVLAITPDGKTVISGSPDGTLRLWDLSQGRLVRTLLGHETAITGVAVTPRGQFVVSASKDRTLKVWDLVTGSELAVVAVDSVVQSLAVLPDGITLFAGDQSGAVSCFRLLG